MKKENQQLFILFFLLLSFLLAQGFIFLWWEKKQTEKFLEYINNIIHYADIEKLITNENRNKDGIYYIIIDKKLKVKTKEIPENSITKEEITFARMQKTEIYNLEKRYIIIPFKKYIIIAKLAKNKINSKLWVTETIFIILWVTIFSLYIKKKITPNKTIKRLINALEKELALEGNKITIEEFTKKAIKIIKQQKEKILNQEEIIKEREKEIKKLERELRKTKQDLETTQNSLLQAGSLMALGEFAAGISHELNNPLGIVLGFTQILLDEFSLDNPHYNKLKRMETELKRAQKIIQDLLSFARPAAPKKIWININQIVQETIQLISYSIPKNIKLETKLENKLPLCLVDPDQLEQVLINIINNAIDAMPEGGTLHISTKLYRLRTQDCYELGLAITQSSQNLLETQDPSQRMPKTKQYKPGTFAICIDISDTGMGIASEDLEKIFTPFFTTKKKGTGLGLSICWKLIRQNNGILRVKSYPGKGSTFRIILPIEEQGNDPKR